MTASHQSLYPTPPTAALKEAYVGKNLQDVAAPAAIIDRAIVKRNCSQMLRSCEALGCSFRPHVKTHKVLYGIPAPPSTIRRLAQLSKRLQPGSVAVLVDHPDQLRHLEVFKEITGYRLLLYIKIDTGYHRAGITHGSLHFSELVSRILLEEEELPYTEFCGLYSHAGHSYGRSSAIQAMDLLLEEIGNLQLTSAHIRKLYPTRVHRSMILSVGATPTATSIQNISQHYANDSSQPTLKPGQADTLDRYIRDIKANNDRLEVHAGVYPFLDLQQLATQAGPSASTLSTRSTISCRDIAMTILAEVASLYDARDKREALLAAGSLALGREPCKMYQGWGIVSDWNTTSRPTGRDSCWQVGRISQEHGILDQIPNSPDDLAELSVGQKLRIFPNHACIAGAHFGWYLVVDSDLPEARRDEIVDVWVRCRGW
ncbi:MAG: hypothetical protein LQ343_003376 [Gyalolechia ehrenbergii]|nr:MAG: hypothetical protein LQ343_003376 [Gyalolechia ehrenbergii]